MLLVFWWFSKSGKFVGCLLVAARAFLRERGFFRCSCDWQRIGKCDIATEYGQGYYFENKSIVGR